MAADPRRLTLLEVLPSRLLGVGIQVSHRVALSREAVLRGQALAESVKPLMRQQSEILLDTERLMGEQRCDAFVAQQEKRVADLEASRQQLRQSLNYRG